MPYFSTIIPAYNRADLIGATIDSLLAQEFADQEIIVVDDGSTDNTVQVLASYGDRIRVLSQPNRGPGAARNTGIAAATGRYFTMFDSDDVWFPWTLATYRDVIEQNDQPAFIAGRPFQFERPEQLASATRGPLQVQAFDNYLSSLSAKNGWTPAAGWRWYGNSSFVLKAETVRALGGYSDERISTDDTDMALRIGSAGRFVQIASPHTFGYRSHANNISSNLDTGARSMWFLIDSERRGRYGRAEYRRERIHLISMFARPTSLGLLWRGSSAEAWKFFRAIFQWNVQLGRVRYLVAFPLMAAQGLFKKWLRLGKR
jgi:GT2 family glycosyltransferase